MYPLQLALVYVCWRQKCMTIHVFCNATLYRTNLRSACNSLSVHAHKLTSHRIVCSAIPLWELQISNTCIIGYRHTEPLIMELSHGNCWLKLLVHPNAGTRERLCTWMRIYYITVTHIVHNAEDLSGYDFNIWNYSIYFDWIWYFEFTTKAVDRIHRVYTMHGASFLNCARNSRCTAITDLDTSKRSTQKAFSCCDAIL